MERKGKCVYFCPAIMASLSAIWVVLVLEVDVQPIGPQGSLVGLASINAFFFSLLGVNILWYHITDWLGIAAIMVAMAFAVTGLVQWVSRRDVRKVDRSILALGAIYVITIALYVFFEKNVVNFRPIIMPGCTKPEASFPSSHTMIVCAIMGTAKLEWRRRVSNCRLRRLLEGFSVGIMAVTVIGRSISGVHWFTDIVGGILISATFVSLYHAVIAFFAGDQHSRLTTKIRRKSE